MKKTCLATIISIFLFTITCNVNAQTENMQTFLDEEIQEIKITVNATAKTKPNENITVKLTMNSLRRFYINVKYFNFSVFGFINGTDKIMLYNITKENFPLPYECNFTCTVPEQVWGVTHGEITLKYDTTYTTPQITISYEDLIGFSMTPVENIYLKTVEEQLENLNKAWEQLNQTFREYFGKDLTPENFNSTCRDLKGSQNELGSTRMAVAVLAITTVFFVATTAYLFLQKPKQAW
ncbi:MAG: hypothetical protein QXI91_04375 [Candidatus Bathyarchaeia archaeon]